MRVRLPGCTLAINKSTVDLCNEYIITAILLQDVGIIATLFLLFVRQYGD